MLQSNGATPLYIASQKGHAECVRALVDGGAVIDQAAVGRVCSIALCCGDCVGDDPWEPVFVHV
jgi:hypothetical protein